ncbi:50S ribosomal protein L11 methyltransferase [Myxococcota bacterium]|nr:50S ribosomal protein L11 methyltransferase [Myxococcota bacterium]
MDLSQFADPWEQLRLLSDAPRNALLVELLRRRAPGARVLEVGCGTGLLSCAAAALGAKKVYAVEPTPLVEVARALVEANGLSGRVTVLQGTVQSLKPRKVDLIFSELLNADPFLEEVTEAMGAASAWLVPGGHMAPSRLRVYGALVRDQGSAQEVRRATREITSLGSRLGLNVDPVLQALSKPAPYRYVASSLQLCSAPTLLFDLPLGGGAAPPERVEAALMASQADIVGGVAVWFEADYDEGLVLRNSPGHGGHWGQLVCAWPEERGVAEGQLVRVCVEVTEDGVEVSPA